MSVREDYIDWKNGPCNKPVPVDGIAWHIWQDAYRSGALAMREKCADLAAEHIASESSIVGLVAAIRALDVD